MPFIQPTHGHRQEILAYLLFAVLLLLIGLSAKVAYQYMLPTENWITLGNTTQFSINKPQRITVGRVNVWVVNTGRELMALNTMPNDYPTYRVEWEGAAWHEAQWYSDPMRGTRYTRLGLYAYYGPAPDRSLDRYPVRVNAVGELAININSPILGPTLEQLPQACIPQRPYKPDLQRMQECDESWLLVLRAEKE